LGAAVPGGGEVLRMKKWALLWLLAIYVLNADSLPIEHAELSIESSDMNQLSALEGKLSRSAADMMKGLLGADASTKNVAKSLGEGRRGWRRVKGKSADRVAQKASLREELSSVESSMHRMEAGAGRVLGRDKRIGHLAMRKAVDAEQRREHFSRDKAAADTQHLMKERTQQATWVQHMSTALKQVETEADTESKYDDQAIHIENRFQNKHVAVAPVELPHKELIQSEQAASSTQLQLDKLRKGARNMERELGASLRPTTSSVPAQHSLGEAGDSITELKRQLTEAHATKKMLEAGGMDVIGQQHQQERHKIAHKVSGMSTTFSNQMPVKLSQLESQLKTERQDEEQLHAQSHKNLRWMERVTAHVQQEASHQFAEFNSILEASHSTRNKADKKLTSLEAMMIALKTKRSLRLQGEV